MNATGHLDDIVALQGALDELKATDEQLHGIPEWMRELHEEHSTRKAEIEELEHELAEAEQLRRTVQAGIEAEQERLQHFQDQIGRVRTEREYGALLQEIDTAKDGIKNGEEELLRVMETLDETRSRLEELRDAFQELDAKYAAELEKWEREKPDVARQAEDLKARIADIKGRLSRSMLSQFDRIFARHEGQALAVVRKTERTGKGPTMWHCSACHYRVRPQVVMEIRTRSALLQCDSCKRFLHLADAD